MTTNDVNEDTPRERERSLRKWTFPLASLILGLVLAEVLCRIFFPSPFTGRQIATGMLHHPLWGAIHEPGASYRSQNPAERSDFAMEINNLGFRGPEILEKSDANYRIVFMGDSFTEGYGVEVEDGLVAQSERRFREANPDIQIEFINAGIRGGAPSTYFRQLDRMLALDPDALVLVAYDNDLADDFYYTVDRDHIRADVYRPIHSLPFESRFVELIGELIVRARHTRAVSRAQGLVGGITVRASTPVYGSGNIHEDPVGFYVRPDSWEPLWNETRKSIDKIAEVTKAVGIDFAIVYIPCPQTGIHGDCCEGIYPAPEGMEPGEYSPFGEWLQDFSAERDLPFIDVGETLIQLSKDGDSEMVYEIANGHFNARGNGIVAELVQNTLQSWTQR